MSESEIIEVIRTVDKKFCSSDGTLAKEITLTAEEYRILRFTAMNKWVELHYTNVLENGDWAKS